MNGAKLEKTANDYDWKSEVSLFTNKKKIARFKCYDKSLEFLTSTGVS